MVRVILNTLLQRNKHKQVFYVVSRFYRTLYQKEFTVSPFCNIKLNLPINVLLSPLDVHKYKDCDKLLVSVVSKSENVSPRLNCNLNGDNVDICGEFNNNVDVLCKIEAPVKANLDITTEINGYVDLSGFNGDRIHVKSTRGNINASKCHCNEISITSSSGNITCTNVMQAAKIVLKTGKYGAVNTGRLQGLNLHIETENGGIETESSYCNNSTFISKMGNLNLKNVHKDCKIMIEKKGNLTITCFDGILEAFVNEGNADILMSRILGKSEIRVNGNGLVDVKLSETCLEETCFKISAKDVQIANDINRSKYIIGEEIVLNPKEQVDVVIDGKESAVKVQKASWMDMFNLKLPNV